MKTPAALMAKENKAVMGFLYSYWPMSWFWKTLENCKMYKKHIKVHILSVKKPQKYSANPVRWQKNPNFVQFTSCLERKHKGLLLTTNQPFFLIRDNLQNGKAIKSNFLVFCTTSLLHVANWVKIAWNCDQAEQKMSPHFFVGYNFRFGQSS